MCTRCNTLHRAVVEAGQKVAHIMEMLDNIEPYVHTDYPGDDKARELGKELVEISTEASMAITRLSIIMGFATGSLPSECLSLLQSVAVQGEMSLLSQALLSGEVKIMELTQENLERLMRDLGLEDDNDDA